MSAACNLQCASTHGMTSQVLRPFPLPFSRSLCPISERRPRQPHPPLDHRQTTDTRRMFPPAPQISPDSRWRNTAQIHDETIRVTPSIPTPVRPCPTPALPMPIPPDDHRSWLALSPSPSQPPPRPTPAPSSPPLPSYAPPLQYLLHFLPYRTTVPLVT